MRSPGGAGPATGRGRGRHARRAAHRWLTPLVLAGSVLAAMVAVGVITGTLPGRGADRAAAPVPVEAALVEPPLPARTGSLGVSRAERPAAPSQRPSLSPSPSPVPPVRATPRRPSPPPAAPNVPGLSREQARNAAQIVQAGRERDLPRRALVVAIATALQESTLRNLANPTVPASLAQRHEGTGTNFDSLGLFQQRPSQGWGSVEQLMNPRFAASAFYARLVQVPGWERLSVAAAAQAVQRSAFATAYAKHEGRAAQIVDQLSP